MTTIGKKFGAIVLGTGLILGLAAAPAQADSGRRQEGLFIGFYSNLGPVHVSPGYFRYPHGHHHGQHRHHDHHRDHHHHHRRDDRHHHGHQHGHSHR